MTATEVNQVADTGIDIFAEQTAWHKEESTNTSFYMITHAVHHNNYETCGTAVTYHPYKFVNFPFLLYWKDSLKYKIDSSIEVLIKDYCICRLHYTAPHLFLGEKTKCHRELLPQN